jgi:hypothetical protein
LTEAQLTPEHRARLAPFWITPSMLEPARLSYRVVIQVKHIPTVRDFIELSFGERLYFGVKWPTSLQLAQKLRLDANQINVEVINEDLFQITSLTSYLDAAIARERAHTLWEGSGIATYYQSQQLTYAMYGIEEVETTYRVWIGGCGDWRDITRDRDGFLKSKAFELTLIHALDVDGYRAWEPWTTAKQSDQEVLVSLHEQRMQSRHISQLARAESEQWLKEHRSATITQDDDAARRKRRPTKTTGRRQRAD